MLRRRGFDVAQMSPLLESYTPDSLVISNLGTPQVIKDLIHSAFGLSGQQMLQRGIDISSWTHLMLEFSNVKFKICFQNNGDPVQAIQKWMMASHLPGHGFLTVLLLEGDTLAIVTDDKLRVLSVLYDATLSRAAAVSRWNEIFVDDSDQHQVFKDVIRPMLDFGEDGEGFVWHQVPAKSFRPDNTVTLKARRLNGNLLQLQPN